MIQHWNQEINVQSERSSFSQSHYEFKMGDIATYHEFHGLGKNYCLESTGKENRGSQWAKPEQRVWLKKTADGYEQFVKEKINMFENVVSEFNKQAKYKKK